MPEGHEGREIYGVIADPHPDKGRALGRLEERQGRKIEKSGGHKSSLPSGEGNVVRPGEGGTQGYGEADGAPSS